MYMSLPHTFAFDKDGRKAEWRESFMAHLKMIVQQHKGECVKMGWDPLRNTRAEVQLKPLSEKQLLNPVYRYPTEAEIQHRLMKYETQVRGCYIYYYTCKLHAEALTYL
jgi:hypothetical protein